MNVTKKVCFAGMAILLSLSACTFAQNAKSSASVTDDTVPTLTMTPQDIRRCGMSILTPKLLGVHNATNCSSGNWQGKDVSGDGAALATVTTEYVTGFKTGDGPADGYYPDGAIKDINFFVLPVNMEFFFAHVAHNAIRRRKDGYIYDPVPVLCGSNDNNQINTPINGSNWHGVLIEEHPGKQGASKHSDDCYSPKKYRCVAMIIGNAKETAVLAPRCFRRKHADNLYHGLSFDIFMSMVKTIRFVEQ